MFTVIPSEEIAYRSDFSLLCNARGIRQAVEVGTDRGIFARDFLRRWDGDELFLVDDYEEYAELPYDRSGDLMVAALALQPFHGRYRFIMAHSLKAAGDLDVMPWFNPGFVYIDAAHHYEAVRADLAAWWERLGTHGILAGHDFDDTHPGVVRAVREFAEERDLCVRLTDEPLASWYVYKTEPQHLMRRFFDNATVPNTRYAAPAEPEEHHA